MSPSPHPQVTSAHLTLTIEEQLFEAIKMKAEAFANAGWQLHWARHGPGLLSQGWKAAYPHVPLEKIQTLSGIDFLCHGMGGLGMRLGDEQDSIADG